MSRRIGWLLLLAAAVSGAECSNKAGAKSRSAPEGSNLPPAERDAHQLGREIFELVDRAIDYRGSHRGRPATTLRMMGIDSLTTTTVRRVVNVQREPVVTVAFRQPAGREIVSCRGDSQILEEASLKGRFTLMCTASSGVQRPMEVGQ
jgi:hypothetical protein